MLRILTINVAIQDIRIFNHTFYRPVNYIEQRLSRFIQYLDGSNVDIVFIQEIFHARNQQRLFDAVKTVFPYAKGFARYGIKFRLGNELLILSKYPLTSGNLVCFKSTTFEEKLFTSKGFYISEIYLPGIGNISLINAHLTAGGLHHHPEDEYCVQLRKKQINQLIKHLDKNKPAIIAGDFNAGIEASSVNYKQLLDAGLTDAFVMAGGKGISWNPENPLVKYGGENLLPPQRIDHILLNQAALNTFEPVNAEITLQDLSISDEKNIPIPVSDHYGVTVELKHHV